jgi:hypothetical protein
LLVACIYRIGELLSLRVDANRTCADVRALALAKVHTVDGKIAELRRIADVLNRFARACRGRGPTSTCPILDMLDQEDPDASR